ncbi:MAG: ATP-binding cassette domain-containing protein [Ruthenibacterium lactatiformans]
MLRLRRRRARLSHVSFTVRPGQTIGILGSTGAGKSSLVQLLQRLCPSPPDASRFRFDVNDIERHHLRATWASFWEPFLYSRTIGENIAIARPDADLSDVYAAAPPRYTDVIQGFSGLRHRGRRARRDTPADNSARGHRPHAAADTLS